MLQVRCNRTLLALEDEEALAQHVDRLKANLLAHAAELRSASSRGGSEVCCNTWLHAFVQLCSDNISQQGCGAIA